MRRRILRWELPEEPPPRRPYRDSLLLHLAFALIIVGVAWATGGRLARALGFAAVFFVVATSWSWWKWRRRLERDRLAAQEAPAGRPSSRT